jgi:hypothetical protein
LASVLGDTGKAGAVADNWLRLAGNVIVDRALKSGASLPLAELEAFVRETANLDAARVLAEVIERDARDMGRADAPLRAAADAVVIDTSALSVDAAVARGSTDTE